MSIPKAVAASTLTPGVYTKVNLLAGAANPGSGSLNVLLIAPKSSAGDLAVNTEIRAGGGPGSALTAYGPGTLGHLAAIQIYRKDPTALVDFCAPTAGSGTATLDIDVTGAPDEDIAVDFMIMGREFAVLWANGEDNDDFIDRAIDEINSRTQDLFVTASTPGTGVLRLSAKIAGKVGNDVLVSIKLAQAQTATEAVDIYGTTDTVAPLSGGSTDFDVTTVMALAAGKEYHFIALCTSNADVQTSGSNVNPKRIQTAIYSRNSGLNAKLQQCILWSTGAQSAAKTGAVNLNDPVFEHGNTINGQSLPCEFMGRECGSRLASDKVDPAGNRISEVLEGVFSSYQPQTDNLTLSQSEDALHNGVSPTAYSANSTPYLVRPITTYSQDSTGKNDVRCLDVQNVSATYIVARDIRDNLPLAFPNAKIMRNAVATSDPPDIPGVVEERDVFGWVAERLRVWAKQGVLDFNNVEAVIAGTDSELGKLIVQVDDEDETQVNLVIPFSIVKPLAKFSEYVQRFN